MAVKAWNPYLESYLECIGQILPTHGEEHHGAMSRGVMHSYYVRDKCIKEYAFAIPNEEAIDTLIQYGPIVEIGCGLGYWARLVQDAGGEIIPYDAHVNDKGMVKLYMHKDKYAQPHTRVFHGTHEVVALHSNMTLFLCWPPYYNSMAHDCIQTYLQHGGQTVIYVGEGYGGCTGDDAFHNLLSEHMEVAKTVSIPVWPGIHDRLDVYVRKMT